VKFHIADDEYVSLADSETFIFNVECPIALEHVHDFKEIVAGGNEPVIEGNDIAVDGKRKTVVELDIEPALSGIDNIL
jgi:hypothetical protein